jgi:hypothetical protein
MEADARLRTTIVLCIFAVAFIALTVASYTRESATVDEPQHLTAGYTALRLHDYRIDPEHPPLLRMWAALPLLAMSDVRIDTNNAAWATANEWEFSHHFLYELNDADRLLYRARFMTVLLGILLGIMVFGWARELFGFWTAASVLTLYCVEPNILAHSSLVTTDIGLACFSFGTLYFLWRTTRRITYGNVFTTVVFFALAQTSKFSALILGPIVLILLVVHSLRKNAWPCTVVGAGELRSSRLRILAFLVVVGLLALTSFAAVWAVYGLRYGPIVPSQDLLIVHDNPQFLRQAGMMGHVAEWLDRRKLVPDAYAQSFVLSQIKAQHRTAYLAGRTSRTGWWYYFPAAFLVKTPLTVLFVFVCGLTLLVQKRAPWKGHTIFLVLPPAVILGAAMMSHLDIGLRHILPIYPFVLLIAGITLEAMRAKWRTGALLVPVALASVELATVYPHPLAFFNQIVGPANGPRILLDSNIDWGQDLKGLKRWMDAQHVQHINLSYFGNADPAYYGINATYLPGSPLFAASRVRDPQLPGYIAVSAQNLYGVLRDAPVPNVYAPLLEHKPSAVIGYSIYIYWVESTWWYTSHR